MTSFVSVKPEDRIRLGHHDVADGGEPGAATERRTVHAPDHDRGNGVDREKHLRGRSSVAHVVVVRVPAILAIHAASAPALNTLPAPAKTTTRSAHRLRARSPTL
jgi:hypothetical protein